MEFENAFLTLTKDCDNYYKSEKAEYNTAVNNIKRDFSKKHDDIHAQLAQIELQLNAVTLIHPELFEKAEHIAKLLEIGRADTLKEAINLAFEEDRKDAEEISRQLEASRQEAILEQQAEEARMHQQALERATREHNAAMEKQAHEHNLAMQAIAKEQNRLAKEQNNIARKQNEFTAADHRRCQNCKNRSSCSRDIHNCGSFVADI